MSSRSLGELLLRPSSTLSRLSTIPQTCRTTARLISPSASLLTPSRRAISNTPKQDEQQPRQQQQQQQQQRRQQPPPNPFQDLTPARSRPASGNGTQNQQDISSQIDGILASSNISPMARFTPNAAAPGTAENSPSTMKERSNRVFGENFSRARPGYRNQRPGQKRHLDVSSINLGPVADLPPGVTAGGGVPTLPSTAMPAIPEAEKIYPRLSPTYGRTVDLDPARNKDLMRGLNMLNMLVRRNRIPQDVRRQKFHERPGLKRKRLASERWRARFKIGFDKVTARVTELTRKGW